MAITAKDKLREGPRGSSKQKAVIGVHILEVPVVSSSGIQDLQLSSGDVKIPFPFGTTCMLTDVECFTPTGFAHGTGDAPTLKVGLAGGDTDGFATFDLSADIAAGGFATKTAGPLDPYAEANFIDADSPIQFAFVKAGTAANPTGGLMLRFTLEAVSGGLFED